MPNETTPPATDDVTTGDQSQNTTTTPELGEAGQRAIAAEREARKAAEKQARDAQAELDKLRTASMSEQEKAVAQARAEGKEEAFKDATARLVRAEVRAAGAKKLADPSDAIGLLDLDSFVDDKGEVDTKAITSAIDALVKSKPYLSAKPGNGSGEGGARGGSVTTEPTMDDRLRAAARNKTSSAL